MKKQIFIQNEYGDYDETIGNMSNSIYRIGFFLMSEVGIDEND